MPLATSRPNLKTVVILGASYGGTRAAQVLAQGIPEGWRIVLVDRNSHANHVYILPRFAVLPGHEHKAFIPYDNVFQQNDPSSSSPHVCIQAVVVSFGHRSVTLSRSFPEYGIHSQTLDFDYAIYALGSHLPSPVNLWKTPTGDAAPFHKVSAAEPSDYHGTKKEGIAWLRRNQKMVEESSSVLVVGGGALGIQFATDIAEVHPGKKVTLLHSRRRLLPRFDQAMHAEILLSLESLNVDVILGERLDLQSTCGARQKLNKRGQRVVRTTTGREIAADILLLCTGQTPNTNPIKEMDIATVDPSTGLAHVLRTMQLGIIPRDPSEVLTPPKSAVPTLCPTINALTNDAGSKTLSEALERGTRGVPGSSGLDGAAEVALPISSEPHLEAELPEESTPYPHIFVVGDAADAFGAINAGYNAYYQGEVAARNIVKLIRRRQSKDPLEPLEMYAPKKPAIKVSLGLSKCIYQFDGVVGVRTDEQEDLDAVGVWSFFGQKVEKEEDMFA